MTLNILLIAHGHPELSKGGAEIAAYDELQELNRRPSCRATLLAAHNKPGLNHTGTPFSAIGAGREILFSGEADHFLFSANHLPHLTGDFAHFLADLKPDVIHFHHYVKLGIEMIRIARQVCPDARILLTLHEYLAICNNNGQMLKTDGQLCHRSSPAECHLCMPGKSPQDFFLRQSYIRSFFSLVDAFVAPSLFLKSRYVAWGLAPERVHVLENGQTERPAVAPRELSPGGRRDRFAYFGQITPYKGVDLLLKAFDHLPAGIKQTAILDIHGGGHEVFGESFRSQIERQFSNAHANVRYRGRYAPGDMAGLMSEADWVIVPSIWWENSPLVIQEAYWHGRPVLCGDIGGMAEKVVDGVSGRHFRAGDAQSLADRIVELVERTESWERLRGGIAAPPRIAATVDALLDIANVPGCRSAAALTD